MPILEVIIVVSLMVLSFIAGMVIANHYNETAKAETKEALQRQFVRLQARADADDPCMPYIPVRKFSPVPENTGDFDGDEETPGPIDNNFMDTLREKGKAITKIRRSDIAT